MRQYMVVSRDALQNRIRTSEHFPKIVTMHCGDNHSSEEILESVFAPEPFRARNGKQYVIVPMDNAKVVTIRPKQPEYDYTVRPFDG